MKKSFDNKAFDNSKGGALSFGKIVKEVTGKRVGHKTNKTVKAQGSYVLKSAYAGVAFVLAGGKEIALKGADLSNAVIVAADTETGDEYVTTLLDTRTLKFFSKINRGKLNLGDKQRIATDRSFAKVSDRTSIDRRIARLNDAGLKTEAKEIKQFLADNKNTDGFKKLDITNIVSKLRDYNNKMFLTKFKTQRDEYIASL